MKVLGDVKGKDVVIIDDMVDTAGTLTKSVDLMIEQGSSTVRAYCTHGVLSKDAYEKLDNSSLSELVITNTIPKQHRTIKVREVSQTVFKDNSICSK